MLLEAPLRFEPAAAADLDHLVLLRIEAMKESLERIGRFDPARARERFASGFSPERTRHILWEGRRVGFLTVKPFPDHLLLDHPRYPSRGSGARYRRRSIESRFPGCGRPGDSGAGRGLAGQRCQPVLCPERFRRGIRKRVGHPLRPAHWNCGRGDRRREKAPLLKAGRL